MLTTEASNYREDLTLLPPFGHEEYYVDMHDMNISCVEITI